MDGDREQGSIIDLRILKESFSNLKLNQARTILEFQLGWVFTQSSVFQIYREWSIEKIESLLPCMEGFIIEITFQITPAPSRCSNIPVTHVHFKMLSGFKLAAFHRVSLGKEPRY